MTAYMQLAIASARAGMEAGEGGPFGACVACEGKAIATAHNTVLRDQDATCHAEINAIRAASRSLGTHILDKCVLYTTSEPCPMCLAAVYWARIPKIVVGIPREWAARYGFDDALFYEELALPFSKRTLITEMGCLEDQCGALFADWQTRNGQIY